MSQFLNGVYIAAGVVFLFGAAIFVHEFGHYWVARKRGLKVEAFRHRVRPEDFLLGARRHRVFGALDSGGRLCEIAADDHFRRHRRRRQGRGRAARRAVFQDSGCRRRAVHERRLCLCHCLPSFIWSALPVPVNPSIIGYVDPRFGRGEDGDSRGRPHRGDQRQAGQIVGGSLQFDDSGADQRVAGDIVHDGVSNTYMLKAEVSNLVGLKTLDLDPRDHLIIRAIQAGKPADAAHLKADDEVVGFAGSAGQQPAAIDQPDPKAGQPSHAHRWSSGAAKLLALTVTPAMDPTTKKCLIGVEFSLGKDVYEIEHPTPWAQVRDVCQQVYSTISALVHSHESGVRASDLSGPVGIIGVLAVQANTDYRLALSFLVMLNINLAILNMLPMPVLDGGHIVMAMLERIRRRPLEVRFVEYTTTAFAVLLISFMIYVTFFDIKRIPLFQLMFNRESQIEQPEKPAEVAVPDMQKERPVQIEPAQKPAAPPPPASTAHKTCAFVLRLISIPAARPAKWWWAIRPAAGVVIGGDHPVVKQSMITCDTMDTAPVRPANPGTGGRRLPDRAHHRADGQGRRQFERHRGRAARPRLPGRRLWRTFISSPMRRWKRPGGSRWCGSTRGITRTRRNLPCGNTRDGEYDAELARLEEQFTPLVRLCKESGARPAHRHQSRLAQRPDHEPLRRHAAGHGGERAGIRPHRPADRITTTSNSP